MFWAVFFSEKGKLFIVQTYCQTTCQNSSLIKRNNKKQQQQQTLSFGRAAVAGVLSGVSAATDSTANTELWQQNALPINVHNLPISLWLHGSWPMHINFQNEPCFTQGFGQRLETAGLGYFLFSLKLTARTTLISSKWLEYIHLS